MQEEQVEKFIELTREEKLAKVEQLRTQADELELEVELTWDEKVKKSKNLQKDINKIGTFYAEIYMSSEVPSGPWYIKDLDMGELIIPRNNRLYSSFLKQVLDLKEPKIYKKLFDEIKLGEERADVYEASRLRFDENKNKQEEEKS